MCRLLKGEKETKELQDEIDTNIMKHFAGIYLILSGQLYLLPI